MMADKLEQYLVGALRDLKRFKIDNLLERRYKRLREIGELAEA